MTEKERRRLEKLARKETNRAKREEKKAKKREEKKGVRLRDRAPDDDEPVFDG